MRAPETPGRIKWVGSSLDDLREMPEDVRRDIGAALYEVQCGGKPTSAKPLTGFGPGVLEIVADHDGDTYRAVYFVRYEEAVYVLHSFQKKSKQGIKTPSTDLAIIKRRLKLVEEAERERKKASKKG